MNVWSLRVACHKLGVAHDGDALRSAIHGPVGHDDGVVNHWRGWLVHIRGHHGLDSGKHGLALVLAGSGGLHHAHALELERVGGPYWDGEGDLLPTGPFGVWAINVDGGSCARLHLKAWPGVVAVAVQPHSHCLGLSGDFHRLRCHGVCTAGSGGGGKVVGELDCGFAVWPRSARQFARCAVRLEGPV